MNAGDILSTIFSHQLVRWVLALIAVNVISGLAAGLYTRNLRLAEIADWLMTRAIPYVLGGSCMQILLMFGVPEFGGLTEAAGSAVWLFIVGALLGKILDNLKTLGLPVPNVLTDSPKTNATATP